MISVALKPINYGGRLYEVGDKLTGVPVEMLQSFKDAGHATDIQTSTESPAPDIASMTLPELTKFVVTIDHATIIQSLIEQERTIEKPRPSAVKVLEQRLKKLTANE